jgi:hypothetical protein
MAADVLLERPHARGRDALDVITTVGFAHAIARRVWLGVEAVGSDLERLWKSDESEGGATVLLGPTLAPAPSARLRLVMGGRTGGASDEKYGAHRDGRPRCRPSQRVRAQDLGAGGVVNRHHTHIRLNAGSQLRPMLPGCLWLEHRRAPVRALA